jgi:hypothetical protein
MLRHTYESLDPRIHPLEFAAMPARVIHYGPDECHRLMVLESAGYAVEDCDCLEKMRGLLADGTAADAVLVSDGHGVSLREVVVVARANSSLPVILFLNTNLAYDDAGVDLVVHCLTPPEVWLNDVESLIEKTRDTMRA